MKVGAGHADHFSGEDRGEAMRLTPRLFVVLVVAAVALMTLAGLDSFAPASCSDADTTFNTGLTAKAQKAYESILAEEPDSACAAGGLKEVANRRCSEANRLRKEKVLDEAKKGYTALLAMEPSNLPTKDTDKTQTATVPKTDAVACALVGLQAIAAKQKAAKDAADKAAKKAGEENAETTAEQAPRCTCTTACPTPRTTSSQCRKRSGTKHPRADRAAPARMGRS